MSDCRRIESLLPPYVDGEASPDTVATVEAHLEVCAACRAQVEAERTVRTVLRARAPQLAAAAPSGLQTRIAASLQPRGSVISGQWSRKRVLSGHRPLVTGHWSGRLSAVMATAAMVLLVITAFEFVSPQSNVLYAAQLAVDHVRCFVAELGSLEAADGNRLRQEYERNYGWQVKVPPSNPEAGIVLVAARRCPFWLGDHAHLLYRVANREVSLYFTQGVQHSRDELSVLGHDYRIWMGKGGSYAVVARDVPAAELRKIAEYLETQTK